MQISISIKNFFCNLIGMLKCWLVEKHVWYEVQICHWPMLLQILHFQTSIIFPLVSYALFTFTLSHNYKRMFIFFLGNTLEMSINCCQLIKIVDSYVTNLKWNYQKMTNIELFKYRKSNYQNFYLQLFLLDLISPVNDT